MCPLFFIFFTKWQPINTYEKYFLFQLQSFFRSRDIQFFLFLYSCFFFPVGHCFRWSKINLKVLSWWPVALHVIKQVQKNSFISDVLYDQDWWCNRKQFLIIPKITSAKLFKPIHDVINYSTFICPFWSGKREKERKKLPKYWTSSEQKELFT